jgi:hypothetical protein
MVRVRTAFVYTSALLYVIGFDAPRFAAAQAKDLAYTTVTPCRIIDTRNIGSPLVVGTVRDFRVKGAGFSSQGGSSSDCGVPADAAGAVINFTATESTAQGNFRAWAYPEASPPFASLINYTAGVSIANAAPVPLCSGSCSYDIRVLASGLSNAHLVADVYGYFRKPLATPTTCTSPPCTVALCGFNATCNNGTLSFATSPCTAVSQSGGCTSANGSCVVCAGPALPKNSSAICGYNPSCGAGGTLGYTSLTSGSPPCSAVAVGGVCSGTLTCTVCATP